MDAIEAIRTRRSLRQLSDRDVAREIVDEMLALACVAPAPHHTRPWRYVIVSPARREALAERWARRGARTSSATGIRRR